jgi:hypothetical protein
MLLQSINRLLSSTSVLAKSLVLQIFLSFSALGSKPSGTGQGKHSYVRGRVYPKIFGSVTGANGLRQIFSTQRRLVYVSQHKTSYAENQIEGTHGKKGG